MEKQEFRRVMVCRNGWTIVPAMTDEEALEKVKQLEENDFDWESLDSGLLNDAEVVEQCSEYGDDI